MTAEEDEPIILVGSEGFRIELSPKSRALVWNAVRRGLATSPEEFITRALDEWLAEAQREELQAKDKLNPEAGRPEKT